VGFAQRRWSDYVSKKLNELENKINTRLLEFLKKNKKHVRMITKTFILMLITSFIAGFCYEPNDYYFALTYIVIIAIFLYFVPFEGIFFPQTLENKKPKGKKVNTKKEINIDARTRA